MGKLRVLILASLFAAVGCVAGSQNDKASAVITDVADAEGMLRPYLGRWIPTSFAEERNMVSLTISPTNLSIQTGGVLSFSSVRQAEGAVVMQAIDPARPGAEGAFAIGLRLAQQQRMNSVSGQESNRELLWIYWCDSLEQLTGSVEDWQCSQNSYFRRVAN